MRKLTFNHFIDTGLISSRYFIKIAKKKINFFIPDIYGSIKFAPLCSRYSFVKYKFFYLDWVTANQINERFYQLLMRKMFSMKTENFFYENPIRSFFFLVSTQVLIETFKLLSIRKWKELACYSYSHNLTWSHSWSHNLIE